MLEPDVNLLATLFAITLRSATPLIFAGLGELVYERSGVLNLSVEGMMLVGACGAVVAQLSGLPFVAAFVAAGILGALAGLIHASFCVLLRTNQAVTGLALLFLFQGVTSVFGRGLVGKPIESPVWVAANSQLENIPFLGGFLAGVDPFFCVAVFLAAAVSWFLFRSRQGVFLRACGEKATAARSAGIDIAKTRVVAGCFCGALCGIAGAHLSLVYTGQWQENMVSGRGWIALVLVIFARWRPRLLVLGACLFGGVSAGQLSLQVNGVEGSQYLLAMMPFLITVIILSLASWRVSSHPGWMPAELAGGGQGRTIMLE